MDLNAAVRRLYHGIRRFGWIEGARLGLRLWAIGRGDGKTPQTLSVPGLAHPIRLRPGSSDIQNFEQIFLRRGFAVSDYAQGRRLVELSAAARGAQVVVDGGAYVGLAALWFAVQFPRATVFAVEPDPENFALLRANVASYPNIVPIQAGLWDRPASLALRNLGDDPWARDVADDAADGSPAVAAVTIPDLLARAPADATLLVVKLTIEGSERTLFRSNLGWLARARLTMFMPNDWRHPGASRVALRALAAEPCDWIVREGCLFCFRDPGA